MNFGSGAGGWRRSHRYVMDRNGSMYELDIGIPGKPEPHMLE